MKIPEKITCDREGCVATAAFRVTTEHLDRPWGYRRSIIAFEFCEEHADGFSMNGRGAWNTPPLRQGAPRDL
jgi:hypothetical protein